MRIRRNAKLPSAASSRKGELVLHRSSVSSTSETDDATPHVPATASRTGEITDAEATVAVLPARYVLLPLATALTGYTVKAMQRKIERGDWSEGRVWRHAPDGRIVIDLVGYQRWVESR
jgi:hypothetical protein